MIVNEHRKKKCREGMQKNKIIGKYVTCAYKYVHTRQRTNTHIADLGLLTYITFSLKLLSLANLIIIQLNIH